MPASAARAATADRRRVPRRPLRRRHPAARLDQRPRRPHRRARPWCSATASAPAPGPGRRCCARTAASASSRGTTAAPAAPTGPPTPQRVGIEEFVEDALSVMDHFGVDRARADGLVDGREHDVRARRAPTPSGSRGLFAVAGVPGDTFATMLGPLRLPARRRPGAHRQPLPGLRYGGRRADPDHLPAAGRPARHRRC